jgi:coenzyme F420-dependent glucose-6-phosphate dehydrogenase
MIFSESPQKSSRRSSRRIESGELEAMRIGFHASHEQWPPSVLLESVLHAERAGFAAAMCSDHFHPWISRLGQSGFAWSWLGAALQASSLSFGTVCAPGQRYHPAVIAQAAATLAQMSGDRFWLALGSGEALNESVTGDPWPSKTERNLRLKECVDVIRALWSGETVSFSGRVTVREAKLYTRPPSPIPILGAALSPETAHWAGEWADGLITAGSDPGILRRIVEAFREGGGTDKPVYLQVCITFADSDEEARRIARDEWPQAALSGEQLSDLKSPHEFERATRLVTPETIGQKLRATSSWSQVGDWLQSDAEIGFDRAYIHPLGRDLGRFIDGFATHVLPAFRTEVSSAAQH